MKLNVNGNNIEVDNIRELELRCNFEDVITDFEFDFDSIVIPRPYTRTIDDWIENGGGVSVGIPSTVNVDNDTSIDSYIDLMDGFIKRTREYEVKIKKRKGMDNFIDYSQGVTFEWLNAQGVTFTADKIKYLIIPENQKQEALSLYIALFMVGVQVYTVLKAISDLASDLAENLQADPVGAGSTAAANIARLLAQTAYLFGIVTLSIELIKRIKELIFPKIRELYAPTIKNLIQKACEFKGYTLQSTLLDAFSTLSIIPVPKTKNKQSIFKLQENQITDVYNYPYPTSMDFCNTLDSLIQSVLVLFDAEIRVTDGIVRIETQNYWINSANVNFVEMFNLQDSKQLESRLNTNESYTRYYLNYTVDTVDTHTSNDLNNTFTEYGAQNTYQTTQDLNLLKNLYQRNFSYSLGSIKTDLTFVEQICLNFFEKLDDLINTAGGNSNTANIVNNRLNILQISNQFFSNTKIYRNGTGGKVASNYSDVYTPKLWTNYHQLNRAEINGWEIFENMPTVINMQTAQSLFSNNYCLMNGSIVKILNFKFNWRTKIGSITYKKKNNYLNGKVTTFAIA